MQKGYLSQAARGRCAEGEEVHWSPTRLYMGEEWWLREFVQIR